jgi:serine/threonine protein kinase
MTQWPLPNTKEFNEVLPLSATDPLIGQQIGNFLVQEALGRGGMARVYKGIDLGLKRQVAIKVISESFRASGTYAQRFEREAQAVANLKHSNIVTVFHFGKHESLYYLVMEYIDGADLDRINQNYEASGELMPHADVVRILEAVASALDYAHRQGVIHRDVKPSNVMLEHDGRPVLTDFGLALRVSEGTVGDAFGSPHYISPEQARNSANAVPQSDLYSLAVIAYELLAGAVPFDDPNPTALAMQHIMAAVPSPRAFNRDLSEQVEYVLLKGLAKTPEERFHTGAEFVATLADALQALAQQPARVSTADLPPLPPGITPPDPRRLSMQTALDKVNQEMALTHAKGQSVTRYPDTAMSRGHQRPTSGWLPYLVAVVGALFALGVIGVLVIGSLANVAVPTATFIPATIQIAAAPTVTSTHTSVPTLIATSQVILPTMTMSPVPPTAEPPSPTLPTTISPTVAPTTIPTVILPTTPPTIPPATQSSEGLPITLIWDENVFYLANKGSQRLPMSNIAFERVLKNGGFANLYSGGRWARYSPSYPYVEPRKCVILEAPGKGAPYLRDECPLGQNAEIYATRGELFWTPDASSDEFRVLWNNQEIGRCAIAQQRCELRIALA